ncbi:MAG: hypothetical protein HC905_23425 [Bacteroidales bacterium]|nr:hypothetical protein [Bacteroidales bacterium]
MHDSIDQNEYAQVYHETMAYYYYLKGDYKKVLEQAAGAFRINPENIRIQQFVMESLLKNLQEESLIETISIDSLIGFTETFPFFTRPINLPANSWLWFCKRYCGSQPKF